MRSLLLIVWLLAIPFDGAAQVTGTSSSSACEIDSSKLRHMCMLVNNRTPANTEAGGVMFQYQVAMLDAACVSLDRHHALTDDDKRRIGLVWDQSRGALSCNSVQFDVPNGSIVKYGVKSAFDVFVIDLVRWDVDLNWVDASDGRTVLDYVDYFRKRYSGNALGTKFDAYYRSLSKAGARHASEL